MNFGFNSYTGHLDPSKKKHRHQLIKKVTIDLLKTYKTLNSEYEDYFIPKRFLTYPYQGIHN